MTSAAETYRTDGWAPNIEGGGFDFISRRPGAASWLVLGGATDTMYRTQGLTLIQWIQCAVGAVPNGVWGDHTNAAIRRKLQRRGMSDAMIVDGTITPAMMKVAIGLALQPSPTLPLPEVILPSEHSRILLPAWARRPESDGEYAGLIWSTANNPNGMASDFAMPAANRHSRYRRPICDRAGPIAYGHLGRSAGVNLRSAGNPPVLAVAADGTEIDTVADEEDFSPGSGKSWSPTPAGLSKTTIAVAVVAAVAIVAVVVVMTSSPSRRDRGRGRRDDLLAQAQPAPTTLA